MILELISCLQTDRQTVPWRDRNFEGALGVTNGTGVREESPLDCCTLKKGAALSYETSVTFYFCAVSGIDIVN